MLLLFFIDRCFLFVVRRSLILFVLCVLFIFIFPTLRDWICAEDGNKCKSKRNQDHTEVSNTNNPAASMTTPIRKEEVYIAACTKEWNDKRRRQGEVESELANLVE